MEKIKNILFVQEWLAVYLIGLFIVIQGFSPLTTFALTAGNTAVGSLVTGLQRTDEVRGLVGDLNAQSGVKDAAGDLYIGMGTSPGKIIKVNPTTLTRMAELELQTGQNDLETAIADMDNEYGYFATNTAPSQIIKVDLAALTVVGSITLEAGENNMVTSLMDPSGDFIYFISNNTVDPAKMVKIDLNTFERVGAITFATGESRIGGGAVDAVHNFAYLSTAGPNPVQIIKIDLSNFTRVGAITSPYTANHFVGAVDPAGNFAYFARGTGSAIIQKIDLNTFSIVGELNLTGTFNARTAFITSGGVNLYIIGTGSSGTTGRIERVNLGTFTSSGILNLPANEANVYSIKNVIVDETETFAYFPVNSNPGRVIKMNIGTLTRTGAIDFTVGENLFFISAYDSLRNAIYVGTNTTPAYIVKFDLNNFTRSGAVTLGSSVGIANSMVIDPDNGFLYVGTNNFRVIKIDLDSFVEVASITLPAGESPLVEAEIDPSGNAAYFFTSGTPARAIKIDLDTFTRAGAITFSTGENNVGSTVIDSNGAFLYAGTTTSPGRIVKIDLGSFTRVGAITLLTGENSLSSAEIDSNNQFAYFSVSTSPGRIVKIDLGTFTRANAITLASGNNQPISLGMDRYDDYLYAALQVSNGRYAEIDLKDFVNSNVLVGVSPDSSLVRERITFDPNNLYFYLPVNSSPGVLRKIFLHTVNRKVNLSRITIPEGAEQILNFNVYSKTGDGNLRIGFYDSAKNLIWETSNVSTAGINDDWVTVTTGGGEPSTLTNLAAGDYYIGFQTDSDLFKTVAEWGEAGDSEYMQQAFGAFPETIDDETQIGLELSAFIEYEPAVVVIPAPTVPVPPVATSGGSAAFGSPSCSGEECFGLTIEGPTEPTNPPTESPDENEIPETAKCSGFDDVSINDSDCEAIEFLKEQGAMTGDGSGRFNQDRFLQRDELTKIALMVFELYQLENYCRGELPFPDVTSEDWSYQYVCRAKQLGLVTGYLEGPDAGFFRPERSINRIEFLTLLLRELDEEINVGAYMYADTDLGEWYSRYAAYSKKYELFPGVELSPTSYVTREEAARIIFKLHQLGKF